MEEREFTGVFIPAKLYLDKKLSWTEKILIVEIEALKSKQEPCHANNQHFAEHLNLSTKRVSEIINKLVKEGYIFSKIIYEKETKQIKKRWLLVNHKVYDYFQLDGMEKKLDTYPEKYGDPILKNGDTPIPKNTEENKVNKNNIIPIVPLSETCTCEYHISKSDTCSREAKLMIGKLNLCGQHARIYLTKLGESKLLVNLEKILETADKTQKKEYCIELLNRFWEAYPRKISKGNVEKWFIKNNPSEELINTMISKIELLKQTEQWKSDNGKFIPYPATWLNAKGWEDEVKVKPKMEKRFFN